MQRTRKKSFMRMVAFCSSSFMITGSYAGIPLWSFEPLTATTINIPSNGTATVQYRVTNQSTKLHNLRLNPVQGITQITTGLNVCGNPFVLRGKSSCVLSLQINGSQLSNTITDGPVVCEQGNLNQCYQPTSAHILRITSTPPINDAVINITGSPLSLTVNGAVGQLTINNTSLQTTATNITSDFEGTALDGNVTETGNTCAILPPNSSCTLNYTPGNTPVLQTNFRIRGSNTNTAVAAIKVQSNLSINAINPISGSTSGGTGFTLTGEGLTDTTSVTFDGIAATNINIVNSTTVTGVTPAHAAGTVDVVINSPDGNATLANSYTYENVAIGQLSNGGVVACLNSGNNLIAAIADNSAGIGWGPTGTAVGAGAQSVTDGASNTATIVSVLGSNGGVPYAAQLCDDYEIDSQGNSPCEAGNACYNDWFLPAGDNITLSGQLNCLYTNQVAIGGFALGEYISSSESVLSPTTFAHYQDFIGGVEFVAAKPPARRVRCVRSFNP